MGQGQASETVLGLTMINYIPEGRRFYLAQNELDRYKLGKLAFKTRAGRDLVIVVMGKALAGVTVIGRRVKTKTKGDTK